MAKRIVICSDGTGNTAIKGRGTNVFKVFEAVDLDSHRFDETVTPQVAIYDDGVGTQNFKPVKILAGALGIGLSRNVKHLYSELCRIYDPGDEIFMFGFSRGAFTVRTLVGFIATCGLIDIRRLPDKEKSADGFARAVRLAYRRYRKCYSPGWLKPFTKPSRTPGQQFKEEYSHLEETRVRFLGVWDTVDAVGSPFGLASVVNTVYRFKFPDNNLSSIVDRACHALAIDDERQSFHPLMFNEGAETRGRLTQVWFAGAHSNVGGGYPKQGMSLIALDWMLEEAERAGERFSQHGLRLNNVDRVAFRERATVDDKLYDSRSGLGVFYRWEIRDIEKICREHAVEPLVHVSVLERVAHGTDAYSPGNLPRDATIVFTPPPNRAHASLALARTKAAQEIIKTLPAPSLLQGLKPILRLGTASYYLCLASAIVSLVGISGAAPENLSFDPWPTAVAVVAGIYHAAASPFDTVLRLVTTPPHPLFAGGLISLMLAYALSLVVDRRLSRTFSTFWYQQQQALRTALKAARQQVKKDREHLQPTREELSAV